MGFQLKGELDSLFKIQKINICVVQNCYVANKLSSYM